MTSLMLNTALAYARSGIPAFPCKPDKKPYTLHGFKDATMDEAQIHAWWTQYPDAMIGVPMGKVSGLWALDVDRPKNDDEIDGITSLHQLTATHGLLPFTWAQSTPGGGTHYIHLCPQDGLGIPSSVSKIAPKIDVRGDGGYIIIAPSVNGDGIPYRTINQAPAAYAPEWLVALARQKSKPATQNTAAPTSDIPPAVQNMLPMVSSSYLQAVLDRECAEVAAAPEGKRNDTLNKAAFALGQFVGSGELDEDLVRSRLADAVAAMQNPLQPVEAEKTIGSGIAGGKRKPRSIPVESATAAQASEESIASAFSDRYADALRFCKELGCWFEWSPSKRIWVRDKTDKAFDYARRECRTLNPENKPSIGKSSTAKGVERFARADPRHATTQDMWDRDPFMLGTPDGAINIKI